MIKFDPKLNDQIKQTTDKFNGKISSLRKIGVNTPTKVNVDDLKSSFTDRRKLLSELKTMSAFVNSDMVSRQDYSDYRDQKAERSIKGQMTRQINELNTLLEKNANPLARTNLNNLIQKRALLDLPVTELSSVKRQARNRMLYNYNNRDKVRATFIRNYEDMLYQLAGFSKNNKLAVKMGQMIRRINPEKLINNIKINGYLSSVLVRYKLIKDDITGADLTDDMLERISEELESLL